MRCGLFVAAHGPVATVRDSPFRPRAEPGASCAAPLSQRAPRTAALWPCAATKRPHPLARNSVFGARGQIKAPSSCPGGGRKGAGGLVGEIQKTKNPTVLGAKRQQLDAARQKSPPSPTNEKVFQSACLRKKAGISKSSIPPDESASTLAAACVRSRVRHTLGTAMPE